VQAHIEAGLQFHEALRKYPGTFSPHFVSAVRAGELSSKLPETLGDLKDYLEWADKVISDVRQATMYPAIVLGVILVFMAFLFTFIIPKFAELLDKLHVPQPLLTRMVLTTSDLVRHTWWAWLPAMIFLFVGVPLARKISPKFALAVDRWKLRLPVFGELNLMLALSKFSHNLAILYRSGISIIEALKLCQQGLIGNLYVEQAVGEMSKDVQNGSTISEAMQRQPVFSAMLVRMVTMGENTGNLDKALENVSDYYNDTIPRRIKKLFTMMEPALMLFLIFTVGVIALAIYLPILSLMGHLR
jgi:type IV pilus assembly protein PilC